MVDRSKRPRSQYILFAEKAVEWKADGAVVGATRPRIVKEVKAVLGGRVPVYSPGVGAQGGDLRRALEAGTDYFIIGRSITKDPHPEHAAERYATISTE
jgi:orotidine-5'-phosphate decarboxylase